MLRLISNIISIISFLFGWYYVFDNEFLLSVPCWIIGIIAPYIFKNIEIWYDLHKS
jgi:hypothetical protein